jgi:hypothetical protein
MATPSFSPAHDAVSQSGGRLYGGHCHDRNPSLVGGVDLVAVVHPHDNKQGLGPHRIRPKYEHDGAIGQDSC